MTDKEEIAYVYHCVYSWRGAVRDTVVKLTIPMTSVKGLQAIRNSLDHYVSVVEKTRDVKIVLLATPTLIGYEKDGKPWEPKISRSHSP